MIALEPRRNRTRIAVLALSMLALAGCSQGSEEAAAPEPAATAEPVAELSSSYTEFDLLACEVTGQSEEGASVDYACPGDRGVPVFATDGDGRFDIDVGVRNDRFQTLGAFNTVGERLEWRYRGDDLLAVIYRLNAETFGAPPRSVLMVARPGTEGAPGCVIAQVDGATPDANARAREFADADGAFDCLNAEPESVGTID